MPSLPPRWTLTRLRVPLLTALVVLAGLVQVTAEAGPASATQAPVAFTSSNLPTWQVGGTGGVSGNTQGIAWALAQSGGLVFAGGTFTSIRPPGSAAGSNQTARTNFAVFNAATGNPTSCALTFTRPAAPTTATVRSLAVSPDGTTLYVGGEFSLAGSVKVQNLAAITISTCAVVPGFAPQVNGLVRALTVSGTSVYAGGAFTSVGAVTRNRAFAAVPVGTSGAGSLQAWNPNVDGEVDALAQSPDGSDVVIGGDFDTVGGSASHALAVVDTSAAIVKAYGAGFIPELSAVKSIAVDSTGFYTGNEGEGTGEFDGRIAFNWSDFGQRWRDGCLGATQAVAVYQGLLYVASHAHDCSSQGWFQDGPRNHFLAESTDGDAISSWFPNTNDGLGEALGPRALVVAGSSTGDELWSAGEFTTVNGVAQQGLTRFGQGTDASAPSVPIISVGSPASGRARIAWRTAYDTDDRSLTYKVYRDGTVISTQTADSAFWYRPQLSYTDSGLAVGSSHSYKVSVTDGTTTVTSPAKSVTVGSTSSAYAARILSDGATALWRYDEQGDVFVSDASSNNNNLTLRGTGTYGQPGAIANDPSHALTLPGGSTLLYGEKLAPAPQTFTVEAWIKTTTTSGGKIIGYGDKQWIGSASFDRQIYMANDGTLLFGVFDGTRNTIRSARAYNDGAWHHVAATEDSSGITLYVDGVGVAHSAGVATTNYNGYWHVGGDSLLDWPAQPTSSSFAGTIDETAVYPVSLSRETIADHVSVGGGTLDTGARGPADAYGANTYALDPFLYWRLDESAGATTAADASGHGALGTIQPGVTSGAFGFLGTGAAAAFNGTSTGHVYSNDPFPAPTSLTELAWIKTSSTTGGKIVGFGDQQTANSDNYDRQVWMRDDGRISFGVFAGGAPVAITSTNAYNDGDWHEVVATRSDSGLTLYVDGVVVAASSITDAPQSYYAYVRLGGDNLTGWNAGATSSDVTGTLDEVALFDKALTSDQVVSNYMASGQSGGGDLTPPSTPGNVTAVSTGNDQTVPATIKVSWTASTDAVGVVGYQVYRSATAGFTASAATLIGTTTAATTYSDVARPAGTWYYLVLARDAADNLSLPSNQASVTLLGAAPPADPTVVTLTPSADACANAALPTTNFGTSVLCAKGSPGGISYLRFALPAAPAGKKLVSAVLKIRTTTDAAAGSTFVNTAVLAPDTWDEATLTWNNHPAVGTTGIGQLSGATAPNTSYQLGLSTADLAPLLATQMSLAVISAGSDGLLFLSREATSASSRPQLVLTFQ